MSVAVEEYIAYPKFCGRGRNMDEAKAPALAFQRDFHRPCLKKVIVPPHDKEGRAEFLDLFQG